MLFKALASGQPIKELTFSAVKRKAGTEQVEYFTITLQEVIVSSYQMGGGGGGGGSETVPLDQVSLNFSKIQFSYTPETSSGRVATKVSACWDVNTETECPVR